MLTYNGAKLMHVTSSYLEESKRPGVSQVVDSLCILSAVFTTTTTPKYTIPHVYAPLAVRVMRNHRPSPPCTNPNL